MILQRVGELARKTLQSRGLDLVRFRSLNTILARQQASVVFDVGANCGQYGASLRSQVFLQIGTQGFEKQVLQGAERSLAKLVGTQSEMSLMPLYEGQPQIDEMVALLRSKEFVLWQIHRGLFNRHTGQELETDGVFLRADRVQP